MLAFFVALQLLQLRLLVAVLLEFILVLLDLFLLIEFTLQLFEYLLGLLRQVDRALVL